MRDLIGITYDAGSGGPELTAGEWRQSETSLFLRDTGDLVMGGVRGGAVSNVGFSVTIAPLTVVAQPTAGRGVYRGAFPAGSLELTKTIAAAHATLPRVDALDVKVFDNEADSSGSRGADIQLNQGTAASSPAAPAFTGTGFRLGTFAVPASGSGNPVFTANPNLVGYASAGGILDVATRPSSPREGTVIYNRTTGALEIFHGGTWRSILTTVWSNWTPAWTGSVADPQRGNGVEVGLYRFNGGMIDAYWRYTWGTSYVLGSGLWSWTLPLANHADSVVGMPIGHVGLVDQSAAPSQFLTRTAVVNGNLGFGATTEAGARLTPASPVPTTGDIIFAHVRYRPNVEVL